jgi:hypothetical protein
MSAKRMRGLKRQIAAKVKVCALAAAFLLQLADSELRRKRPSGRSKTILHGEVEDGNHPAPRL